MKTRILLAALALLCSSVNAQISQSGDLTAHIEDNIDAIPTGFETDLYQEPSVSERTLWRSIIQDILASNYSAAHAKALTIDYQVVEYADNSISPAKTYYVLESDPGAMTNYWGTFVFNPSPRRPKLVIQCPHPPDDRKTGREGWLVFTLAGCRAYFVTGAGKCNSSSFTPCDDISQYCTGSWEPHRLGNQAHTVTGTFQMTTDEMLADDADLIFIQPHGYTPRAGDPDIILSNGTLFTPAGTDYMPTLRDNLLGQDATLTFKIPHLDSWSYYAGRTNTQGRLVNGSIDPCEELATAASGNFIHIEQTYYGLRDTESNRYKLANAVALTFPAAGQIVSAQSGSWTESSTWVGGLIPTAADNVLIDAGHTISVDDDNAKCYSLTFGGDDALIDMNAYGELSIYGDFTLYSTTHNVFSAGWSATSAFVRFAGVADQTLSGWNLTEGSTSFRDLIIDKPVGKVLTDGLGMKLGIQNSLQIMSGTLELAAGDDLEARWASSGFFTENQDLDITVESDGALVLADGDGAHIIRSGTGSQPVGKMTVHGNVLLQDASESDISFDDIDVESGGTLELGVGMYSATYFQEFNPGTITVKSEGEILCNTSSDIWFVDAAVIVNQGGTYKTTAETTIFPPTFTNNGKVRYQRNPTTVLTDQIVEDLDYVDVEFSFAGGATQKLWTLAGDRTVQDSLTVNNDAELVIDAAAPQTVSVGGTLRLTTGTVDISDINVDLEIADGAEISRATGTITDVPAFAGTVDVRYTSTTNSVTTGPELPTSSSALGHLTIISEGQTVTLSDDVTVNDTLTISEGTLDDGGYTITLADGLWLRRATGTFSGAPDFGPTVNVEYLSVIDAVTTSHELPTNTSVLNDLKITANKSVTLSSDVTVNGSLAVDGSNFYTNIYTVTLAPGAILTEPNGFVVYGEAQTTHTLAQSTNDDFGGLGVEINAAGGIPGATQVVRVVGSPQTIPGVWSASRYFDITPANNAGLDATFVFHYNENELIGLEESSIALYSSDDGGSTWTPRGGTVDQGANTVTVTGVSSFSRWTLGGPLADLKAAIASGEWDSPTTWLTGTVPTSTDNVLIVEGHTVSIGDYTAECADLTFGGENAHIQMNDDARLDIYGDFTLYNRTHNVFSPGWSATNAFVRFTGTAPIQTISGFSTSGASTSFRDLVIDKASGSVRTEGAGDPGMRLGIENSLEIISGDFFVAAGDDLEARSATTGLRTENQDLNITIQADGYWELSDGAGTHFVRSGLGSMPIGQLTVYGEAKFYDASSYDISIGGIEIKPGGTFRIQSGLGSSTYGPEFNPGVITIDSGATLYTLTTSDVWFDTTVVVLSKNGVYKSASSTTIFPPTLVNNGKVRWQRDPSTTTTDQVVIDTNYTDVEFAFKGNDTKKIWTLYNDRQVADSFIVGNEAETILLSGDASPHEITVNGVLRLTTGILDNSTGLANVAVVDEGTISVARGAITDPPIYLGGVNLRYTSSLGSVTTGPEMPTSSSVLQDLTIFAEGQIVTMGTDATVNRELTLSIGTFDNNGADDDFTLSLVDGVTIRRAQGMFQDEAPAFGPTVNVHYISTVAPVTTGYELPTSPTTLNDLVISGNQGVNLGASVTVNGTLTVSDSNLVTGAFVATLADGASIVETDGYAVEGNVQTTRTATQGVNNDFGGLGVEINAAGGSPGVTAVLRVTGSAQSIGSKESIKRYFDITPANNSGLDATLVFHYHETELNLLEESNLALYSSDDGGTSWTKRDGTVDAIANTVTLAGIGSFSRWTLGPAQAGCCDGDQRGDANLSGGYPDLPTIGDISAMIDAKFISNTCDVKPGETEPVIACLDEADVNASAPAAATCDDITIGDISLLIDYLFITGPASWDASKGADYNGNYPTGEGKLRPCP